MQMKFLNFLITVNLLLSSNIWAEPNNWQYGIKTGIPISNILYTNRVTTHILPDKPYIWMHNFENRTGLNISLNIGYNFGQKIYLGIEPGYLLKGAKFHDYSSNLDLQYINVPLILKYNITDKLRITTGPEFSKLINANLGSIDLSDFYNERIEVSYFSGIEYRLNEIICLGVRISWGLNKISETRWMDENNMVYGVVGEKSIYLLPYFIYSFK